MAHMKNFQSSRQPCFQLCLQLQKVSYTGCSTCPVTGFAMITSYTVTVQISLALSTVVCNDEFTTYWCDQNKVLMSKTMHTSATELTNTPYYSISRHRILLQSWAMPLACCSAYCCVKDIPPNPKCSYQKPNTWHVRISNNTIQKFWYLFLILLRKS